jgi:hypothetical protein
LQRRAFARWTRLLWAGDRDDLLTPKIRHRWPVALS